MWKNLLVLFIIIYFSTAVESRCRYYGRGVICSRNYRWRGSYLRYPYLYERKTVSTVPSIGSRVIDGISNIKNINPLSGINTTTSDLSGILSLDGITNGGIMNFNPLALTKFLTEQINYFKDKILYIFDDFERPLKIKLEIPDFNLLNLWPNLNEKVTFSLFDKANGNNSFDILKVDDEDLLKKSRFNARRPTVLITHGFMASSKGTSVTLVRDAYLRKRDFNVITVNWSPLSVGSYTVARLMVIQVGNHVGKLINFLYKQGMDPNTTVLIGHSLGSHVMGFAGQTAHPNVNHTIGLDPAWPLFVGLGKGQRISNDDAHHVEIIHTNGGLLGIPGVTGDYDFYPNGGSFQNGCDGEWFTACSHGRSYKYLSEQINDEGPSFIAVQCDSYKKFNKGECANSTNRAVMGAVDRTRAAKGAYYLNTNKKRPFGLGFDFLIGAFNNDFK